MLVYLVKNLFNGKMYVGQTTRTLEDRLQEHYYKGYPFGNALRKYGFEGFSYSTIELTSLEELNSVEEHLIRVFDSTDPALGYNLTSGGLNNLHTKATKTKISKANKGRKMSKEQVEKGVKSRLSRPRTEAEQKHLATLITGLKGNQHGVGNTNQRKTVRCIETDTIYDSAYHAGIAMGAKDGNLISRVCRGKGKTAYGYTWEYL